MSHNEELLTQWKEVPARVAELLPLALRIKAASLKAAADTGLSGSTYVTWRPDTDLVTVYTPGNLPASVREKYAQVLGRDCTFAVPADVNVDTDIIVKRAAIDFIAKPFDFAQKALGGPTPLTNALVTGLAGSGIGYGAGTLMENLFPERYLERGKLRRTLAITGLLPGLGLGAMNAATNSAVMGVNYPTGWVTRNDAIERGQVPAIKTSAWPTDPNLVPGDTGLAEPSIDVRRMNDAIWNDARKGMYNGFAQHTPPAYAATASGFMTGLSTGVQSPIIRPIDVINGIASAGVGLATATVAGKALSALAGITPAAQEKLQDMGMWGGMMHAIVPAMLGIR